jgi:hypothetical protein
VAYGFGLVTESQVRALDTAIQALDRQITASREPRVDEPFKEAWRSYTSRWQVQRDSWLAAGSVTRKFGFSEKVFEQYKVAFQKWQTDYQKRITGTAASPPAARPPEPSKPLFGNLFAGSGTAVLIAGLIAGGLYLYTQKRRSR